MKEEIDLTLRLDCFCSLWWFRSKGVGEGLGTRCATAGGSVEETVEAEKGCVRFGRKESRAGENKGGSGGRWQSTQIGAMARPTYFRVLEEQSRAR